MIKRLLFMMCMLLASPLCVMAQTMSDDQIISYVQQQQEKGADQKTIVTNLLKKGVTTEQLRRARKKYQQMMEQPGAVSQSGQKKENDNSRLRTNRDEIVGATSYSYNERKEMMLNELAESPLANEDLGADGDKSRVFGRNIFNNANLTFEPNTNMATPANYRLGAGDHVTIEVWGASQETFEGVISPDGTVTIAGVGPVKLAGMTVSAANSYLKGKLGQFYAGSNIQLTVGETRSVLVQVMGEVKLPGTYTLSSLSSAFNALYAAGGINDIGTLRDIKVYRQGRQVASIDVYDYLLNGNSKGDIRLQDNDIIVVGPYDCLVAIGGKVKRPMFYEMKKTESVATILNYAGGFTGDAYRKNVRLIRKTGAEYSVHTVGEFDMNGFALSDGDSIYVDSIIARFSNMAEIRGAVFHPGMFEVGSKISSVRDLIVAAEGIREDAFTARAVLHRQKDDLSLEVLSVDVAGLVNGTVADIPIRKNDILYIPSKQDMKGDETYTITGEVRYPGTFMFADNTSLEDLVLQAGGLTEAASMVKVDVYRRIVNAKAFEDDENLTETFTFALKDGFVIDGTPGFILKPYDQVVVRKSPSYNNQKNVYVQGAVNFTGVYAMKTKTYRLSDLVKEAGGVAAFGYAKGARLERIMTDEERMQQETSLRAQQIALYEEAMKADKDFDIRMADSLMNMKIDLGNTYPVAIDLEAAINNPGSADDVTLREGDKLIVPQYNSTVKINGEVMYPTSMNYRKGESLSYYIKHAGGYSDKARKSRVYAVYMNGAVEKVKRHSKKSVQPGCTIVVPSKSPKNKMTTAEYMSIGTSSASVATMMVTIANILK